MPTKTNYLTLREIDVQYAQTKVLIETIMERLNNDFFVTPDNLDTKKLYHTCLTLLSTAQPLINPTHDLIAHIALNSPATTKAEITAVKFIPEEEQLMRERAIRYFKQIHQTISSCKSITVLESLLEAFTQSPLPADCLDIIDKGVIKEITTIASTIISTTNHLSDIRNYCILHEFFLCFPKSKTHQELTPSQVDEYKNAILFFWQSVKSENI